MKTINYSQKTDKLANTSSLASMTRTTKIITAAAWAEQKEETYEKNEISFDGYQEKEFSNIEESLAQPKISRTREICMDRPKVCGHRYYYQCALQMLLDERVWAICRRCIVTV